MKDDLQGNNNSKAHVFFHQKLRRPGGSGTFLKVLKEKNCQLRILYVAKIHFRNEGEIKSVSSERKLRGLIASKPVLRELLKDVLQIQGNRRELGRSEMKKEQHKS